ncbi:hypothetical protein [Ferrovibrio sp.]|uniref:hypothetical protein n=1 Tax=Ferrovibrio sp. TaxID=1917215 RepID=UPI003D294CFE
MRRVKEWFGLAAVLALGACASVGPTDDPIRRHYSWDRYVGGDDLAVSCQPGQPARYRLVYNGRHDEQRRSYDFSAQPDGGAMLEARVIGSGSLLRLTVEDPLKPWRGEQALYRLSAAEFSTITKALADAGFEQTAKRNMELRGDDFFWTASACRDGKFHFNAWAAEGYPAETTGFKDLRFLEVLAPFDRTGVAVNPPRKVPLPPYSTLFNETSEKPKVVPPRYIVGDNGLVYTQRAFN